MKRISIIGRGTVGCLAVSHFLRWTNWEINWVYDPAIVPSSVGEGTTRVFPDALFDNLDFDSADMNLVNATSKLGVWKRGWGNGNEFYHAFAAGVTGIHFDAVQLQDFMINKMKDNRRIKIIESNETNYNEMDSDFVMVCTGSPTELTNDFITRTSIPVNSCVVFQCPWDLPKFNYSLTFAKQHGWVFGIPLKNRCSIGYLYNNEFSNESDITDDVQDILDEFNLSPTSIRNLNFTNYSRVTNFTNKVVYNGNASFFLEPLEATSTDLSTRINKMAYDMWNGELTVKNANAIYDIDINEIESMICLHYYARSIYDNKFWDYANRISTTNITNAFMQNKSNVEIIRKSVYQTAGEYEDYNRTVGTWPIRSYYKNIQGLGITDKIIKLVQQYGK